MSFLQLLSKRYFNSELKYRQDYKLIKLITNKQKLEYCSYPIQALVAVPQLFVYFSQVLTDPDLLQITNVYPVKRLSRPLSSAFRLYFSQFRELPMCSWLLLGCQDIEVNLGPMNPITFLKTINLGQLYPRKCSSLKVMNY